MFVILSGNPKDGFEVIGPFRDTELAIKYAEDYGLQDSWWILPLQEGY